MGAESSSLQNCQLDDPYHLSNKQLWQLYPGKTGDGSAVSVFIYEKNDHTQELIEKAAKNLKVLRHPCVVKFLGWTKLGNEHRLITEQVTPLELQLDSLSSLEVCAGLYDILQALAFLHERGGCCHNNISLSTVFIGEDGSWKLGCMEHICRFEEVDKEKLKASAPLRDAKYIAPEEKNGIVCNESNFGYTRDAYSFGVLADELREYITELGSIGELFVESLQQLLNDDAKLRPKLSTFLNDPVFQNDFIEVLSFLKNITLKSDLQKKNFFRNVVEKLHSLPAELVARRLTRPVLSRFVLMEHTAESELIPHFLHPKQENCSFQKNKLSPVLPKGLFQRYVIPELFKIFHVRDCHVRLVILRHFAAYVGLFDKATLQSVILPQVIVGLNDNHDDVVSATFHALAEMVLILGAEVVMGSGRHSVFKEGKPKFATMNGSAIKHVESYKEPMIPGPQKIAGVIPVGNNSTTGDNIESPTVREERKLQKDQAKELERQKRREAARKRMEERRRKKELKDTLEGENNSGHVSSHHPVSLQEISPDITGIENITYKNACTKESGAKELIVSHNENEFGITVNDDDIENEIENEISAMTSTFTSSGDLKQDEGNTDPSLQVHLDWSDVPNAASDDEKYGKIRRGPLKLKMMPVETLIKENVTCSSEIENELKNCEDTNSWGEEDKWSQENWDSFEDFTRETSYDVNIKKESSHEDSVPVSFQSSLHVKQNPTNIKGVKPKPLADELGSEFDIKSISIKSKSSLSCDPTDFFADMEPKIKSNTGSGKSSSPSTPKTVTTKTLSFAVLTDDTDETEAAWGEDLDWGEDTNW